MKKVRRLLAFMMAVSIAVVSAGCSKEVTAEDLMVSVEAENAPSLSLDDMFCEQYSVTAFKMLKSEYSKDSTKVVLSPLAAYYNLSMLQNGATGYQKEKILNMFGKRFLSEKLNLFMHSFDQNLKNSDKSKLYFENAMWFNAEKNIDPSSEFLSTAKTYYCLDAYRESFGQDAVKNINNWASNKTDLYSERLLKEIPTDAPLYLVNTTLLEADWESPITPSSVYDGKFTTNAGDEQDVRMMSSVEKIYLNDTKMCGFIKYYSGGNYAFLALIPHKEGSDALYNMIDSLSSHSVYRNLINKRKGYVFIDAFIPKFTCEYTGEMKNILEKVDLEDIFDPGQNALAAVGTCSENLYVGDLTVSTGLSVTEGGTKKGTGANVGTPDGGVNMIPVNLNRPFVFAVVDTRCYLPVIVGAVNSVND